MPLGQSTTCNSLIEPPAVELARGSNSSRVRLWKGTSSALQAFTISDVANDDQRCNDAPHTHPGNQARKIVFFLIVVFLHLSHHNRNVHRSRCAFSKGASRKLQNFACGQLRTCAASSNATSPCLLPCCTSQVSTRAPTLHLAHFLLP